MLSIFQPKVLSSFDFNGSDDGDGDNLCEVNQGKEEPSLDQEGPSCLSSLCSSLSQCWTSVKKSICGCQGSCFGKSGETTTVLNDVDFLCSEGEFEEGGDEEEIVIFTQPGNAKPVYPINSESSRPKVVIVNSVLSHTTISRNPA